MGRHGLIWPIYAESTAKHQVTKQQHNCQSYRGITLLSVPGKVFAHVLLSRVRERLQEKRRIQQSGFTPRRSTVDRIVKLNMLQQSRREYNRPLWVAYVDLKAAFLSGQWTVLIATRCGFS